MSSLRRIQWALGLRPLPQKQEAPPPRWQGSDVDILVKALYDIADVHLDGGESQGYTDHGYGFMDHCCTECGSIGEFGVEWPCETRQLADEALATLVPESGRKDVP